MMDVVIWAVVGGALILAEFAAPELVVIFFGVGALINALLIAIFPNLRGEIPLQIVLWAATSGLTLAFLRKYAARWFRGNTPQNGNTDAGKTAEVIVSIGPDQPGRIRFRGTTWSATAVGETIPAGTTVTILEKQNLTYLVTQEELT